MNGINKVIVAGWEREALEDVDGKVVYENERGDLVDFYPIRREVTACGRAVVFTEGETYRNSFGEAKVWHIKDETMKVQYLSASGPDVTVGVHYEYPIRAQAEAVVKGQLRKEAEMVRSGVRMLKGDNDMFMAGWLAAKGSFSAYMPEKDVERFVDVYGDVTGEAPAMDKVLLCDTPWGIGWRVTFPMPPEEIRKNIRIPAGVEVREKGGTGEVSKGDFVKGMLKMGMRLGKNADRVGAIAEKLSGEDKRAFLEGAAV